MYFVHQLTLNTPLSHTYTNIKTDNTYTQTPTYTHSYTHMVYNTQTYWRTYTALIMWPIYNCTNNSIKWMNENEWKRMNGNLLQMIVEEFPYWMIFYNMDFPWRFIPWKEIRIVFMVWKELKTTVFYGILPNVRTNWNRTNKLKINMHLKPSWKYYFGIAIWRARYALHNLSSNNIVLFMYAHSTKKTCIKYFQEILKQILQNFLKILNVCFHVWYW